MQQNLIQNRNSCLHLVVFNKISCTSCLTSLIATKFQLLNGHFSTLMKTFKCRDKLKEVYIEYPCAHHLDLTISMFTIYLLIPFIHPFKWSYLRLPYFLWGPQRNFLFDIYQLSCAGHYTRCQKNKHIAHPLYSRLCLWEIVL